MSARRSWGAIHVLRRVLYQVILFPCNDAALKGPRFCSILNELRISPDVSVHRGRVLFLNFVPEPVYCNQCHTLIEKKSDCMTKSGTGNIIVTIGNQRLRESEKENRNFVIGWMRTRPNSNVKYAARSTQHALIFIIEIPVKKIFRSAL